MTNGNNNSETNETRNQSTPPPPPPGPGTRELFENDTSGTSTNSTVRSK